MMKKIFLNKWLLSLCLIAAVVLTQQGCKKDKEEPPANPFASIDYGTVPVDTAPNPNSLLGIHKNILQPRCAVPGCHDGNFEPDFRTPQSAYSTLVYQPVVKNNANETFVYRVVPYKPLESVLYERISNCCFVNQDDRMPQDNIGVPLADSDILAIKTWIEEGTKGMSGAVPSYPNLEPTIESFYAVVDAATFQINYTDANNRIDSVPYNSFLLPDSTNVVFAFLVKDDSTAYQQLQVNQMRLSFDKDDFSNPISFTAQYTYIPPPDENHFFAITINTSQLPHNQVVYMRYFVNDGDHTNNTQFPTDNLPDPYKTYWSFYVY
jgi:hypothetical protein